MAGVEAPPESGYIDEVPVWKEKYRPNPEYPGTLAPTLTPENFPVESLDLDGPDHEGLEVLAFHPIPEPPCEAQVEVVQFIRDEGLYYEETEEELEQKRVRALRRSAVAKSRAKAATDDEDLIDDTLEDDDDDPMDDQMVLKALQGRPAANDDFMMNDGDDGDLDADSMLM